MPTRPPGTPDLDLTTAGSSGSILGDSAVFQTIDVQPAGSGVFNPFVQIEHSPTEQGYNTDYSVPQFNEKTDPGFNHSLLLAAVPIVVGDGSNGTAEGVKYRMFTLDLNDPNNSPYVSLDSLQIYQEEAGNLTGFTPGSGFSGSHTNYLAYNLDAGGDHWIALNEQSHGSGQADVVVLIPDANFINDAAHRYVTLYSLFGGQTGWSSDGGFEEWATNGGPNSGPLSAVAVHKTASVPVADNGTADRVGEVITYTITVDNVGNTALTNVVLTDTQIPALAPGETLSPPSGDAGTIGTLDVGETWTYTLTHTVTQSDLDSDGAGTGLIANTVTVHTAQTAPVSATASVTVVPLPPTLQMTKTPSVSSVDAAGQTITYTIDVTNIGVTTLTGLVVTDPQLTNSTPIYDVPILNNGYNVGDLNQNGVVDPGEIFQFTRVPVLGTFDIKAQVLNGDYNVGDLNQNGIQDPGETFQYTDTFITANIGDTNLNGVEDTGEHFQYYNAGDANHNGVQDAGETFQFHVDHIVPLVSGDANSDGNLNVGETWVYTVTYTVTQADIDNGYVVNPALTHDNTSSAVVNEGSSTDATAHVAILQKPDLSVTKTISGITEAAPVPFGDGKVHTVGDVIAYTITVHNDGNMSLTNVAVSDSLLPPLGTPTGDGGTVGVLDVGETWTYTATYTVKQSDIDNGDVVNPALTLSNTATADSNQTDPTVADGTPPALNDTFTASVAVVQNPSLSVTKSAWFTGMGQNPGLADKGTVVSYFIDVANTGNMSLTGVLVSDSFLGTLSSPTGDTNGDGKLSVGETWHYTATYTVTQADIDSRGVVAGDTVADDNIRNTVNVTTTQGTTGGVPGANGTAHADVPLHYAPALSLVKGGGTTYVDSNHDGVDDVGDTITYTFTVSNTGNVTLHGVTINDPGVVSGGPIVLAVGASDSTTFTGVYHITQADLDAGTHANTATASATEPAPVATSNTVTTTLPQLPSLTVVKAGSYADTNGDGVDDVGDTINYTFTVNNTGNITLHNVTVADTGVAMSGTPITLSPGASDTSTFTGVYHITQADLDAGSHANTATASSTESASATSNTVITSLPKHPTLSLVKTGTYVDSNSDHTIDVGDTISYTFTVTNTGNVTLHNVAVTDPGATISGVAIASLSPGATDTSSFTGVYNITQADIDAGHYANTATASSTESAPATNSADVSLVPPNPHFTLVVTALGYHDNDGGGTPTAGDIIDFKAHITNDGNVTLTNVNVSDAPDGAIIYSSQIASLAPSAAADIFGTHGIVSGESSLSVTEIGQSDQAFNVHVPVSLNYASLSPI